MTSWPDFVTAEPAFAGRARLALDAHEVKVLASLRADGAPRVSGIEVEFDDDGEMVLGSMSDARKGADLRRDPRFALHSVPTVTLDQKGAAGDVKVDGRALRTGAPAGDSGGDRFVVDLHRVTCVALNDAQDRLVVEWWTPEHGRQRVERE